MEHNLFCSFEILNSHVTRGTTKNTRVQIILDYDLSHTEQINHLFFKISSQQSCDHV